MLGRFPLPSEVPTLRGNLPRSTKDLIQVFKDFVEAKLDDVCGDDHHFMRLADMTLHVPDNGFPTLFLPATGPLSPSRLFVAQDVEGTLESFGEQQKLPVLELSISQTARHLPWTVHHHGDMLLLAFNKWLYWIAAMKQLHPVFRYTKPLLKVEPGWFKTTVSLEFRFVAGKYL